MAALRDVEDPREIAPELRRRDFARLPFVSPRLHHAASTREAEGVVTERFEEVNEGERGSEDERRRVFQERAGDAAVEGFEIDHPLRVDEVRLGARRRGAELAREEIEHVA